MKKYIKKLIVASFALVFLLGSQSVFATELWNGASNDCPTLAVANFTTNTGLNNPCWPLSSVSANPGETINVRIYYHNSSDLNGSPQTANNTRVILNTPSGSSTSHSFSAQVTSDQGSISSGTVTVNLPSSQTLTFGSTRWYPNQTQSQASFLNGQNGSEIKSGGLSIGAIAPGWNSQGSVVVSFQVGNTGGGGNCSISNFTANGSQSTTIQSGNSVNLVWNTTGYTSVNISGPNFSSSNTSGSATVYPTYSGSYNLTASGGNNCSTQTQSVYVNVNNVQQNYCTISNFTGNGSTTTTVQSGNPVNLVWNTYNCTSATLSGPNGTISNNISGSATVYPTNNSNYVLTAYGQNGSAPSQTVYVNVNPIIIQPPVINNCAVTTVATNVTQTTATLNGLITGNVSTSYFQYGTTVNLGSQTISRVGNGAFSEVISGLVPGLPYYFRLVSQCSGGLSYGQIQVFQTLATTVVRPVIVQGTTVIGTQSPIMLKIENRYQYIGVGDFVDYTVTYKNIGKSTLTRPVLQVIIPRGIVLTNASRGTYSLDTNTLTVPLEDLLPQAEGVVYLQGRVEAITSGTAQIVTTAILVYTSPNGAQENAIAYVLNNPRDLNVLGASAFWSGFLGIGLIGWLLILILILLIILLTRRYYSNRSVVHTTTPTGAHTTTTNY